MRPRIVFFVCAFGFATLSGLYFLRARHGNAETVANLPASTLTDRTAVAQAQPVAPQLTTTNNPTGAAIEMKRPILAVGPSESAQTSAVSKAGQSREDYIEQRVGELYDLGMSDDAKALTTIESEFTNPEPDIRKAAVEAAKQFGSTNAIPFLEQAMSKTESLEDKQDLRDAIEFLKLPSFLARRN